MVSWLHGFIDMAKTYLQLNNIDAYKIAFNLSNQKLQQ